MPKTTSKHFKVFKEEGTKMMSELGLTDWEVTFVHGGTDDFNNAECHYCCGAKFATLKLTEEWGDNDPLTDENIRETAWHEMFHVLLATFENYANSRFLPDGVLDMECHSIIQRLIHYTRRLKSNKNKKK